MMLEYFGANDAAQLVMNALERALELGRARTPDLGGKSSTEEVTNAVLEKLG